MSNRLTIKGQVTIPKAVRDFLGLQEGGSSVEFTINDDGSVTVQLQRKKSGDSNAQLEDVGGVITLKKGNGWQMTVDNQRAASALPLPAQLHIAACWHCSPAVFDWLPK